MTQQNLPELLRAAVLDIRRKPYPISDLIPLLTQAADALSSQGAGEAYCPYCDGSGESTIMSNGGPDAEELPCVCPHCNGAGTLAAAYCGVVKLLEKERTKYLQLAAKDYFASNKLPARNEAAQPARVVGTVTGYQSANSLQQWQFSPSPDAAGLENQRFDVALSTPTAAPAPGHSPGNMAQPIHDPAVTTPREVLVGESPVDRIAAPAHREGYELAIQQAQPTPALKRHALEAADQLSKYAAAPFFPDTYKRGVTRSTTTEWWDGLAELIEEAQPLIVRALRECTEPHDKQQQAGSVMLTDAEKLLPHGYLFAKVAMVVPLLEEARDALTAITEHQRRLHGISPTLADRMDVAGTYSLEDWQEALASQPAQEQVCSSNTAESDQQVGFSSTGDEQQQAGAVVSDAPIVKVMRESPAHRPQLWLLTQAEDGTLKVLGSTNPVDMPSAWVHEYELALSQGGGK